MTAVSSVDLETDNEAFVLAISCHQNSIKLAWEINRALDCDLVAVEELEENLYFIKQLSGQAYFRWVEPSDRVTFHLISNLGDEKLLVPSQKQIDYFFVITGIFKELDFETGTNKIKNIQNVLTAFPITLPKVKK